MVAKRNGGEYFKNEYIQIGALVAMTQVAQSRGIEGGVAFVLVKSIRDDSGEIRFKTVNRTMVREAVGREVEALNPGTNYFGVAMSKLAVMMAHGVCSGIIKSHIREGETSCKGGLIRFVGDFVVYVGFLGSTEDREMEIADVGIKMLFPEEAD